MSLPTLQQLLEAGCHFGHLASRWNPQMKPYIFMEKNGVHVMDLKKTQSKLAIAADEIRKIASRGEHILLVGTKKQAQDIIKTEAARSNNFYVVERWLGGQLTNFSTVKRSVRKWKNLEKKGTDGTYDKISKKEILDIERQKEKLSTVLGGIADMRRIPGAVFVIDTLREHIAIKEAKKLGIPVFAIVDTNSNPHDVDYAIPANDDASKSISILTKTVIDAFLDGASKIKAKKDDSDQADKKTVKRSTKSPAAKVAKAEAEGKATTPEAVEAAADAKAVTKEEKPKAAAKKAPAKTATKTAEKKTAAKKAPAKAAAPKADKTSEKK